MNKFQRLKIIEFFEQIAQTHTLLVSLLNQTTLNTTSIIYQLFSQLSHQKNQIRLQQFIQFLFSQFHINEKQLYQLFAIFDLSRNGYITKEDFLNSLSCKILVQQKTKQYESTKKSAKDQFKQLLFNMVQKQRVLQLYRREFKQINLYKLFDQIDKHKMGYLGYQELKQFFKVNDVIINPQKLESLMTGLKKNIYTRISLEVFCEYINPYEFQYYQGFKRELQKIHNNKIFKQIKAQQDKIQDMKRDILDFVKQQRKNHKRQIVKILHETNQELEYKKVLRIIRQSRIQNKNELLEERDNCNFSKLKTIKKHLSFKDHNQINLLNKENENLINFNSVLNQSFFNKYAEQNPFKSYNSSCVDRIQKQNQIFSFQNQILSQQRYRNAPTQRYNSTQKNNHNLKNSSIMSNRQSYSTDVKYRENMKDKTFRQFELEKQVQKTRMQLERRKNKIKMEGVIHSKIKKRLFQ